MEDKIKIMGLFLILLLAIPITGYFAYNEGYNEGESNYSFSEQIREEKDRAYYTGYQMGYVDGTHGELGAKILIDILKNINYENLTEDEKVEIDLSISGLSLISIPIGGSFEDKLDVFKLINSTSSSL